MQLFVVLITCFHVAAHSVLGCCSHHTSGIFAHGKAAGDSHCCAASCDGDHTVQLEASYHPHSGGTALALEDATRLSDSSPCNSDVPPLPSHRCRHASCDWLASESGDSSSPETYSDQLPVFLAPAAATPTFATVAANLRKAEPRHSFAPPLRLHLVVGVLLI
jgi:hypothetical protein